MKINKFEDLEIWKLSIEIAIEIYKVTNNLKFSKDYGLKDQIRRAAVSISSNIAEGFEMNNNNDLIRFLKISKGSSGEVRSQLLLSFKLGYITETEFNKINIKLLNVSSEIGGFIKYLLKKKQNNEYKTR